jgi:hypothetical protein
MLKSLSLAALLFPLSLSAQQYMRNPFNEAYTEQVKKAEALYEAEDYSKAADAYTKAFADMGDKGKTNDRFMRACCWAMAGNKDSAIVALQKLIPARYHDYNDLVINPDLENLHSDPRWNDIVAGVKVNKEREQAGLDKDLVNQLDTIIQDDQRYRVRLERTAKKYGRDSKEMKELVRVATIADSINTLKVSAIIDKRGWPGTSSAGRDGSRAAFLVIQHADLKVQEKYIPLLRKAVKEKEAEAGWLALMEDRVALEQGKKQIYGSQVIMGPDRIWKLDALEDPDNVDKRRAEVGLEPLAEYLKTWDIKWDVEQYKKEQQGK